MTVKRPKWLEADVTVGIADTLQAAAGARIEHGDIVTLLVGSLRVRARVQESVLEDTLEKGEYLGLVRSVEGTMEKPLGLDAGDLVAFERRHVFAVNKGAAEGGWT